MPMTPAIRSFLAAAVVLQTSLVFTQADMREVSQRPAMTVQGDADIQVDPNYAVLRITPQHDGLGVLALRNVNQAGVARLLADASTLGMLDSDLASAPSKVFPGRWQCIACTDEQKIADTPRAAASR